jgi:hypothetical protein
VEVKELHGLNFQSEIVDPVHGRLDEDSMLNKGALHRQIDDLNTK